MIYISVTSKQTYKRELAVRIFKMAILLVSAVLIGGCSKPTAYPLETSTPSSTAAPTFTEEFTATSTSTITPSPTTTSTPTITSTPTPTPTLTPSPTPALPVRMGTPFPSPSVVVSEENASRLRELARYGTARVVQRVVSPDWSTYFVASADGVDVQDATTGKTVGHIDAYPQQLYTNLPPFVSSSDGSRILGITTDGVRVFSKDGKVLTQLPQSGDNRFTFATLSPDGQLAVVSNCEDWGDECKFEVVRVSDSEVVYRGRGRTPLFSPDGKLLAIDFDRKVWLYQTSGWVQVGKLWKEDAWQKTFSPDGSLLALSHDDQVEVWQLTDNKRVRLIQGFAVKRYYPPRLQFSPDSTKLALLDSAGTYTVWDIRTGERLLKQEGGNYWTSIFRLTDAGEIQEYQPPETGKESVNIDTYSPIHFMPGGTGLLQAGYESNPTTHQFSGRICRFPFDQPARCEKADWPTVLSEDGEVYVLKPGTDAHTYELRPGLQGEGEPIARISSEKLVLPQFVDVGNHLFAYYEGTWGSPYNMGTILWDTDTQKPIKRWYGAFDHVETTLDKRIAVFVIEKLSGYRISGYEYSFIDLVSKKEIQKQETNGCFACGGFLFSPQGNLTLKYEVTNVRDKKVLSLTVKEFPKGKLIASHKLSFQSGEAYISSAGLSPSGKILVVGLSSGEIILINLETGQVIHQWAAHKGGVGNLFFSPDGTLLTTAGGDGFLKLWGVWP